MIRLYKINDPDIMDCYYCDREGNIYSRRYGDIPKKMKTNLTGNKRYEIVHLITTKGHYKFKQVHRLIAQTLCNRPEGKYEVDHINRNSRDNRPQNLRWVTHKENVQNRGEYHRRKRKAS